MDWNAVLNTVLTVFGVPVVLYALNLGRQWVAAHVKDKATQAFAIGALSAGGQAYVEITAARQANPTADLGQLVKAASDKAAARLMSDYAPTVDVLKGSEAQAQRRVTGEIGQLLAADPSVSLAPAMMSVPVPTTLSPPP